MACRTVRLRGGVTVTPHNAPRLLLDSGGYETIAMVRRIREARPHALIYIVASPSSGTHRRLALLARLEVDDVYFGEQSEAHRLLDRLERVCRVQAVIGETLTTAEKRVAESLTTSDPVVLRVLAALARDPCPDWHVRDIVHRLGLEERTCERHFSSAACPPLRTILNVALARRAEMLREMGMPWSSIGALLGAPSREALRARVRRQSAKAG